MLLCALCGVLCAVCCVLTALSLYLSQVSVNALYAADSALRNAGGGPGPAGSATYRNPIFNRGMQFVVSLLFSHGIFLICRSSTPPCPLSAFLHFLRLFGREFHIVIAPL